MGDGRTFWRARGRWLVLVSVVLALGASGFALFGPTGRYVEVEAVSEGSASSGRVVDSGWTTLLGQIRSGEQDPFVLVWLVTPIVIALFPLTLTATRLDFVARTVAALLLLAFTWLTGFSIGLFYVPSAWSMLAAAAVGWATRDSPRRS